MSEYYVPSCDEFIDKVRSSLFYLITEFQFKECESPFKYNSDFSVFFKKGDVFVYVEGVSYGFGLSVKLGKLGYFRKVKESVSLGDILAIRDPNHHKARFPEKRGQLEHIKRSSEELKLYASDFLSGDFKDLPKVKEYVEQHKIKINRQVEKNEIYRIGIKAAEAFRNKEYKKVIDLLQPLESKLGKAKRLLLMQSKKRMTSESS